MSEIAASPAVHIVAPRQSEFARWFKRFMFVPGVGGNFVPLIQAARVFAEHDSKAQSLEGWLVALFCLSCWLMYGVVLKDKVLIIANIVGVINVIVLCIGILMYR
ncbi:MAG: hypothetical protein IT462_01700 [Planctomycetes bacterium]|nr:hypothetical protein [Planctomycetota bacterium]